MKTNIYDLLEILEEKIIKLKEENEALKVKIDAYELYGDQHEEEYKQAFNQGAEAAWELARKITCQPINGGFNRSEFEKIFGYGYISDIFEKYKYTEAATKVAEWEKIKEIKVGDILEDRDEGNKVIVTSLKGRVICLLWDDGRIGTTYVELAKGIFRNTGRHIDIDGFLKQIGEAE